MVAVRIISAVRKDFAAEYGLGVVDQSPLYLRPDAHADPLHFCLPGALNFFAEVTGVAGRRCKFPVSFCYISRDKEVISF